MTRRLSILLLGLFLVAAAQAAERPRLAVVIVVDQFPSGHLEKIPRDGRLSRLIKDAALFRRAAFDSVPTETAPGHATIATGRPPGVHGIIGNDMYDRSKKKSFASISDPEKGRGPHRLECATLGDGLKQKSPASRVISIAGKDRSAILMGGKSADAVLWVEKGRGFVSSPFYGPEPAWLAGVNASLSADPRDALPPFDRRDRAASPATDRAVLAVATTAIAAEQLGADDHPDLLWVSFSATDWVGHRWGPDSPQMKRQLVELDAMLGDLVDAAETAAPGRTVFAFTSDHGVLPMPGSQAGKAVGARRMKLKDFARRLEARLQAARPVGKDAWLAKVNLPDVYLNRSLGGAASDWAKWVREAAAMAAAEPEVAATYVPGRNFDDDFAAVYRRSYVPGRSGDFQIRLRPGVLMTGWSGGTSHGSPYPYDAEVPLAFWGFGIQPGENASRVTVESLAPTLAVLLDALLPPDDGRVLFEALSVPAE